MMKRTVSQESSCERGRALCTRHGDCLGLPLHPNSGTETEEEAFPASLGEELLPPGGNLVGRLEKKHACLSEGTMATSASGSSEVGGISVQTLDEGVQAGPPCSDAPGPGKLVMLQDLKEKSKKRLNGRHGIIRSCHSSGMQMEVELRIDGKDCLVTVPRSCANVWSRSCSDLDPTEVLNVLLRSSVELRKQVCFDLQGSLKDDSVGAAKKKRKCELESLQDKLAAKDLDYARLQEKYDDAEIRLAQSCQSRRQLVEELQFLHSENARLECQRVAGLDDAGQELARQLAEIDEKSRSLSAEMESFARTKDFLDRQQEELEDSIQGLREATDELRRDRNQFQKDTEALQRQQAALEEEKRLHEAAVARDADWLKRERKDVRLASCSSSSTVAARPVEPLGWEWLGDGAWQPFPEAATVTLNRALFAECELVEVQIGGQRYECDLKQLRQTNLSSQRVRAIRLSGLPQHWFSSEEIVNSRFGNSPSPAWELVERQLVGSPHASGFHFTWGPPGNQYLRNRPDLVQKFTQLLRATCYHHLSYVGNSRCDCIKSAKVVSVRQIHNVELLRRYQEFTDELARKHQRHPAAPEAMVPDVKEELRALEQDFELGVGRAPSTRTRERFLWHGTTSMQNIVQDGFDCRLAQDGLFGKATYFACQSCKSYAYCERFGPKTLILARVALGDFSTIHVADQTVCRPPRNPHTDELYDSMMAPPGNIVGGNGGVQFHQEFLTFDNRQALPEFVVEVAL